MLISLSIRNFALIEKLSIDFSDGFSVITGETGAGKSILLGALGLVLGKRADLSSLRKKDEKCVVEAHFDIAAYTLQDFFKHNDLDYEDVTILRREILPTGKSRAFVNDSPVNLPELQELGLFLIDIHSQHQTQELSDEGIQFKIIDAIADNADQLAAFEVQLKGYKTRKQRLADLTFQLQEANKEQDYNAFLLDELVATALKPGLQEELEAVNEQLSNVEAIKESFAKVISLGDNEQFGVLQHLKEIKASLQKIASVSKEYAVLLERTDSTLIELDDIFGEINRHTEKLIDDPAALEKVTQKLQVIYALQKKHQVQSVEELIQLQETLSSKVAVAGDLESGIQKLKEEITADENGLNDKGAVIHQRRSEAIPKLSLQLTTILSQLGMPDARFNIRIVESDHYFLNGKDELQFLFSANKGSDFGLLKKVASGGEMSRIMLAVKAVLARYSKLPTIIFDEIDTGVSGEIANKMGEIMKSMSHEMQVFAITHLPQIAAKGTSHFKVFKSVSNEQTQSDLKQLSPEERITEIAEMLSGKDITDSAIMHAKALLS
ncbi:MAG: DNA repair protein RecN [Flavobacterium sp. BFFFF1]|uniref:DNA repair protein RecN n=1 Tax=Flavobacterium sp. BFFFF1 TaxID=2015557 RepID=UPI000BD89DFF|nr:DNA repair protein RecN [Flavobacterium sp. BFFFF1]OYU81833.1 MAG: DNA repair protein RecN [Flavobacterium sp. BFFFF1]